jgi:hypothetical protein
MSEGRTKLDAYMDIGGRVKHDSREGGGRAKQDARAELLSRAKYDSREAGQVR